MSASEPQPRTISHESRARIAVPRSGGKAVEPELGTSGRHYMAAGIACFALITALLVSNCATPGDTTTGRSSAAGSVRARGGAPTSPPPQLEYFVVSARVTSALNARSEPNTSSAVLASLRAGTVLRALPTPPHKGPSYVWRRLAHEGKIVWVATAFLEGPFPTLARARQRQSVLHQTRKPNTQPEKVSSKISEPVYRPSSTGGSIDAGSKCPYKGTIFHATQTFVGTCLASERCDLQHYCVVAKVTQSGVGSEESVVRVSCHRRARLTRGRMGFVERYFDTIQHGKSADWLEFRIQKGKVLESTFHVAGKSVRCP